MSPDGVWCHARLRDGSGSEPHTVEGDVFLLDRSGEVLTAVRGLRLKRILAAGRSTAEAVIDDLFVPGWEAAKLVASEQDSAEAGNWLIFGDGNTTTDTTRKLLEQRSQTCVLVEPGVDFARLGPGHYRLDPAQPQHFRRLLDDLHAPLQGVVHLWSLMDSMESGRHRRPDQRAASGAGGDSDTAVGFAASVAGDARRPAGRGGCGRRVDRPGASVGHGPQHRP